MPDQVTLYSRYEDGAIPVVVAHKNSHRVYTAQGQTFTSARRLLRHLTNHPTGRNWTFDRYFRTGRYAPPELTVAANQPLPGATILDLLKRPSKGKSAPTLGIDLERRGHEVVKLLFKGFGHRIQREGYDPDDVLQEVYKGLLVRNAGKCPWNPTKSSFGHYVYMVCRCVLSNYHRKQSRRRSVEQLGAFGYQDGHKTVVDAGSDKALYPEVPQTDDTEPSLALWDIHNHLTQSKLANSTEGKLAIRILPLVRQGYNKLEIAKQIGVCPATISKAINLLKRELPKAGFLPPSRPTP